MPALTSSFIYLRSQAQPWRTAPFFVQMNAGCFLFCRQRDLSLLSLDVNG